MRFNGRGYFLATIAIVIVGWWSGSGQLLLMGTTYVTLRSLANLAAFAAAYGMLLQLVFARVPWLDRVFGMDKLSHWHHFLGFAIPAATVAASVVVGRGQSRDVWWNLVEAIHVIRERL